MAEIENLVRQNSEHLLGLIYKLSLKYDSETLQVKDCMIKWIQDVKGQLICNNGNINGR